VKRDILTFLSGVAAAFTFVHVAYAVATARGTISVPIWRGREWGIGKMLIEAVVYGSFGAGLGYLAWRPQSRPMSLDRGGHQ
jgi:NhaP-type Na+/H+ or K+/H+ antiporter